MLRHPSAPMVFMEIMVGFMLFFGTAHAYALPGTANTAAPTYAAPSFGFGSLNAVSWQDLAAPFQNFTQSLQSVGNTNLNVAIPASMPNFSNAAPQAAHDAFEQFDAWLAGVTGGFHIAAVLTVFLQLLSWLLGIVKSIVDWALSWIR